jgi:endonuclease III
MAISRVKEKLPALTTYPQELGLDLHKIKDRFKWFLASILFAKRISASIAMATSREFESASLTSPEAILAAGWDRLVEVLDAGGYVRHDFSTASTLLEVMAKLRKDYGSLEELHYRAQDSEDLEKRLLEFRGIGPVAVNIFLRELRAIWSKANPRPSPFAWQLAKKLRLPASELEVPGVESALVRVYLDFCKRKKCIECPLKAECHRSP